MTGLLLYRMARRGSAGLSPSQGRGAAVLSVAKLAMAYGLPTLIAYAWVYHSDVVKALNPIGRELTSGAIAGWNYGSVEQRFSFQLWHEVILGRTFGFTISMLLAPLMVGYALWRAEPRWRALLIFLLAAFLLPFLIFTNLHVVHDYYQSANMVYWVLAEAAALHVLQQQSGRLLSLVTGAALVLLMLSSFAAFHIWYGASKLIRIPQDSWTLVVADYVRRHTDKEDAIIVNGWDWSSEVAYYSERKALMIPVWGDFHADAVSNTPKYLQVPVSMIVNCPGQHYESIRAQVLQKYGPGTTARLVANCDIYSVEAPQ